MITPFKGVLCPLLLDMGFIAGRGLRKGRGVLDAGAIAFGIVMPMIGAIFGLGAAVLLVLAPRQCTVADGAKCIHLLHRGARYNAYRSA